MLRPLRMSRAIASISPDIVHTHSGVWYKASLAARLASVPHLVHTDHGRQSPDPWHHRLLDRMASRRTDVVVAVSSQLRSDLANIVDDPSRLRVIHNGVDTARYHKSSAPGAVQRALGLPPERRLLGSIGRLDDVKSYDVMLRAFRILRSRCHDAVPPALVIVGEGPEQSRLRTLLTDLHLERDVFLTGWTNDVSCFHPDLTLFTMSSRSEGTSMSLLEAMSAELCPVVTNVGGNADVLGPELRHRMCPPNDPGGLATAWEDAISDPARLARDAKAARRRVVEGFSLASTATKYDLVYTSLMDAMGGARSQR